MARLEYIRLPLERIRLDGDSLLFEPEQILDPRTRLSIPVLLDSVPQIIWSGGETWSEANLWLLRRAQQLLSAKLKADTVAANGKDLLAYANWLELSGKKWWQCPIRDDERPLNLYRGFLVSSCSPETSGLNGGSCENTSASVLSPLLASRRMSTARAFYQWLLAEEILSPGIPLWSEKKISIPYEDALGFKRHVETVQTSLDIKIYRRSNEEGLEEGLQPVSMEVRDAILDLALRRCSRELFFMLSLGFWSGLRLGTICDLKVQSLENAVAVHECPELKNIAIGPQASPPVQMKLGVSSSGVVIPTRLHEELMDYAVDIARGRRVAKATPKNKNLLFLTTYGNSYGSAGSDRSPSLNAEMSRLKRLAREEGLKIDDFTFHWSRATFATMWARAARDRGQLYEFFPTLKRMLAHKHDRTTWRYIRWVEKEDARAAVMDEFTKTMFGRFHKTSDSSDA